MQPHATRDAKIFEIQACAFKAAPLCGLFPVENAQVEGASVEDASRAKLERAESILSSLWSMHEEAQKGTRGLDASDRRAMIELGREASRLVSQALRLHHQKEQARDPTFLANAHADLAELSALRGNLERAGLHASRAAKLNPRYGGIVYLRGNELIAVEATAERLIRFSRRHGVRVGWTTPLSRPEVDRFLKSERFTFRTLAGTRAKIALGIAKVLSGNNYIASRDKVLLILGGNIGSHGSRSREDIVAQVASSGEDMTPEEILEGALDQLADKSRILSTVEENHLMDLVVAHLPRNFRDLRPEDREALHRLGKGSNEDRGVWIRAAQYEQQGRERGWTRQAGHEAVQLYLRYGINIPTQDDAEKVAASIVGADPKSLEMAGKGMHLAPAVARGIGLIAFEKAKAEQQLVTAHGFSESLAKQIVLLRARYGVEYSVGSDGDVSIVFVAGAARRLGRNLAESQTAAFLDRDLDDEGRQLLARATSDR